MLLSAATGRVQPVLSIRLRPVCLSSAMIAHRLPFSGSRALTVPPGCSFYFGSCAVFLSASVLFCLWHSGNKGRLPYLIFLVCIVRSLLLSSTLSGRTCLGSPCFVICAVLKKPQLDKSIVAVFFQPHSDNALLPPGRKEVGCHYENTDDSKTTTTTTAAHKLNW